ncbi:hypothetical protein VPZ60_004265 [Salmonella enterica]|nr:hypothetical protein [Salmonella enterica]
MATTDTNIVSPNLSQGRDRNASQTIDVQAVDSKGAPLWQTDASGAELKDSAGNKIPVIEKAISILTGEPPRTSLDVYQEQEAAAIAKHPKQAAVDYNADPMWGLQDGQTEVTGKVNTVRLPGFLEETLPPPQLQQPDFGWTPNPQDVTPVIPPAVPHVLPSGDVVEQPDFGWNPQDSELPRPEPVVHLPGSYSPDPVLQPNFGWTPNPEDAKPKEWYTERLAREKAEEEAAAAAAATKP